MTLAVPPTVWLAVPAGDCEAAVGSSLAQPVNAASSTAYLAAAVLIGVVVARREAPASFAALALAVGAEGAGSIGFHATGGPLAVAVHNAALVAVLGFVAAWHLARLDRWRRPPPLRATLVSAGMAAAGLVLLAVGLVGGRATWLVDAALALTVGAAISGELAARRRGLRPVVDAPTTGLALVALAAWWAGRTGSPWCRPGSVVQLHAVWHLLSAALVVRWACRAADRSPLATTAQPRRYPPGRT